MAEITAAAVKALRDKTGLPMMECKKALQATGGDEQAAIDWLRKDKASRCRKAAAAAKPSFGRIGVYADWDKGVGAMVELQCESAPVAGNAEFVALANDLAKQLATGPGREDGRRAARRSRRPASRARRWANRWTTCSTASARCSRSAGSSRIDGKCGGYVHHAGKTVGVLVEVEGGNAEAAKDIAMHIAAMRPAGR